MFYKGILLCSILLLSGCSYFTVGEQDTFQELDGKQFRNCGTSKSYVDLLNDETNSVHDYYKNCITDPKKQKWLEEPVYEKSEIY